MGNDYSISCLNCKETFFLGKETEFIYDKELLYCFRDFLLSHTNHVLKVGGDEWNTAFDNEGKKLPNGYKMFDDVCSKQDYKEEQKRLRRNKDGS